MLKFVKGGDDNQEMLRVLAMLILAHTTEEEENEKIIDETGRLFWFSAIIQLYNEELRALAM